MISPVWSWMTRMSRSSMSRMMRVPSRVRPRPMWCRWPLWRRVTLPSSDAVVADAVVGVVGAGGGGFGARLVGDGGVVGVVEGVGGGGGGCSCRRRRRGGVGARRWWRLVVGCGSHFFMVCWKRSTLPQVVGWLGREFFWRTPRRVEEGLEAVAATSAAGEPGGEDHAVVGQCRGWDAVGVAGSAVKASTTIGPVTRRWAVTERA